MSDTLKQCTSCKKNLPATPEYFYRDNRKRDGLRCHCKTCVKDRYYDADAAAEYGRQYRKKNRERILRKKHEYYWKNRDRIIEKHRQWVDENREDVNRRQMETFRKKYRNNPEFRKRHNERNKNWRKENPEAWKNYYKRNSDTIKERARQWEIENPERKRKRRREWYKKNIKERRIKRRIHSAIYRARKSGAPGQYTDNDIREKYKIQNGKCYYCFESITGGYHVDHVTPLSRGGTNNPSNIVLTCATCNLSKGNKLLHEWDGTDRLL